MPIPREIVPLTQPPALVEVAIGEGRYLVDGINWAAAEASPDK